MLQLDAEAAVRLRKWETEIEVMLGEGGQMEIMRDWGAKLAGATLRLAEVTGPGRPPSPTYEVNPTFFVTAHQDKAAKPEKRSHNSRNSADEPESGHSGNIGSALAPSATTHRAQVKI